MLAELIIFIVALIIFFILVGIAVSAELDDEK